VIVPEAVGPIALTSVRTVGIRTVRGTWITSTISQLICWSSFDAFLFEWKVTTVSSTPKRSLKPLWKSSLRDSSSHAQCARIPSLRSLTGVALAVMVRLVSRKPSSPDIRADTYTCIACNLKTEEQEPWLLQRVVEPQGQHTVMHTLALAIDSSTTSETELTTEERLDRLEKKFEEQAAASREMHTRFENHEKVMEEGLQEIVRSLHQILADKLPNGSETIGAKVEIPDLNPLCVVLGN
jgi:hypothetical protein